MTTPTTFYTSISGVNARTSGVGFTTINLFNISCSGSQLIICTASNYTIEGTYIGGSGVLTFNQSYFKATRIG